LPDVRWLANRFEMIASACRSETCQRQRALPSAPRPKAISPVVRPEAVHTGDIGALWGRGPRPTPRRRSVIESGTGMTRASSGATAIGGSQEDQPRAIALCCRVVHCGLVGSRTFGVATGRGLFYNL
jgi:hypothetical protein